MIEKIQVQNFQKHDRLRVAFDPAVTTIVGPSDTGKSALLRAIRWLTFNRPLGDGFKRHGEELCSVKLWVDGKLVERKKSRSKNTYSIDGKQLSAVGTDVPDEVRDLLNLTPDNFQGQHDPPFWFSLTAGEVAKRLNSVVDLEVIDRSASWLAGRLRKARTSLDVCRERLAEATREVVALEFVAEMEREAGRLFSAQEDAEQRGEKRDRMAEGLSNALRSLRIASDARRRSDGVNRPMCGARPLEGHQEAHRAHCVVRSVEN